MNLTKPNSRTFADLHRYVQTLLVIIIIMFFFCFLFCLFHQQISVSDVRSARVTRQKYGADFCFWRCEPTFFCWGIRFPARTRTLLRSTRVPSRTFVILCHTFIYTHDCGGFGKCTWSFRGHLSSLSGGPHRELPHLVFSARRYGEFQRTENKKHRFTFAQTKCLAHNQQFIFSTRNIWTRRFAGFLFPNDHIIVRKETFHIIYLFVAQVDAWDTVGAWYESKIVGMHKDGFLVGLNFFFLFFIFFLNLWEEAHFCYCRSVAVSKRVEFMMRIGSLWGMGGLLGWRVAVRFFAIGLSPYAHDTLSNRRMGRVTIGWQHMDRGKVIG